MVVDAVQLAKQPQDDTNTPPIIRVHNHMLKFQREMAALTHELDSRVIASPKEAIPGMYELVAAFRALIVSDQRSSHRHLGALGPKPTDAHQVSSRWFDPESDD